MIGLWLINLFIAIALLDSIHIQDSILLYNEYNYSNEIDVSFELFNNIRRKFNATDYFIGILIHFFVCFNIL